MTLALQLTSFVGSLPAECGVVCDSACCASSMSAVAVTTPASGVASFCATNGGTAPAEGGSAADCLVDDAASSCSVGNVAVDCSAAVVATSADTPVWVGVGPADAMVSAAHRCRAGVRTARTLHIPERGSAVEDVEPEGEPVSAADELVADVGSVDDGLAADSDDEIEGDDDESDDELEDLESVGSANATPGVLATAAPTPRITASTPTRPMYCAFIGIPLSLAARPYERQPVSSFLDC